MDVVTVLIIVVIAILFFVILKTLSNSTSHPVKSKENKKREIIDAYKRQLDDALLSLQEDQEALKIKKRALLKEFSIELSHNIFFDHDEMRDVIRELASYEQI